MTVRCATEAWFSFKCCQQDLVDNYFISVVEPTRFFSLREVYSVHFSHSSELISISHHFFWEHCKPHKPLLNKPNSRCPWKADWIKFSFASISLWSVFVYFKFKAVADHLWDKARNSCNLKSSDKMTILANIFWQNY